MSAPFKMKYTDGKKADSSAFPFSKVPLQEPLNTIGGSSTQEIVGKKIDDEIKRAVVSSIGGSKDTNDESSN